MKRYLSFITSCLFLILATVVFQQVASGRHVKIVDVRLDRFPKKIGEYASTDMPMKETILQELNADFYLFRSYKNDQNKVIIVYIGYYGTKKGGRTGHSPEGCYPGGGWSIIKQFKDAITINYNNKEKIKQINGMEVKKGNINELVYHWYQSRETEILSTGVQENINRFINKIFYNRNDGAFVRVSSNIEENYDATKTKLNLFIREIIPLLAKHWPIEAEVNP